MPTAICSPDSIRCHRFAVRLDERRLHVVDGLDGAAELGHAVHLLAGALEQLGDEPLHHLGALEDVRILEQVGLVGEDLLQAERPLLVPRPGQAERLVPGGQLDRPRASVPAEGDRQRLERDPVDVVLGLGLGQAERVDLHAVAQAAVLLVLDAVALAPELVPQGRHRAQLACSSMNRTPALTKNEMRPNTLPIRSGSGRPPARLTASRTAIALLIANAISWTGVAPASWRW